MRTLASILTPGLQLIGDSSTLIRGLALDSRLVQPGDIFFAIGEGHNFIAHAIERGAVAVVCAWPPNGVPGETAVVIAPDTAQTMGEMASAFYDHPSQHLKIVAITGTNGKTTTATLLYKLAQALGERAGLISTIENRIGNRSLPATHTTPDSLNLHALLAQMVEAGCGYVFMEASSHGLTQKRLAGVRLTGGVFTNITHDHLDYHGTFDNYIRAKKMLFDALPAEAFALVNKDDKRWAFMLQNCRARHRTFALGSPADYQGRVLENTFEGLCLSLDGQQIWVRLIGQFNAYNLLGIYGTACELGFEREAVLESLSMLTPAPGRFELVPGPHQIMGIVDYAHTPDALKNVLTTIVEISHSNFRENRVICVVGCGGDRDKTKRPLMAQIAVKNAKMVVLTSDNPRSEDPWAILADMSKGLSPDDSKNVYQIVDREQAIAFAVQSARPGDIILIAGKGHETYQEIAGQKYPFDDREVLARYFKTKA